MLLHVEYQTRLRRFLEYWISIAPPSVEYQIDRVSDDLLSIRYRSRLRRFVEYLISIASQTGLRLLSIKRVSDDSLSIGYQSRLQFVAYQIKIALSDNGRILRLIEEVGASVVVVCLVV